MEVFPPEELLLDEVGLEVSPVGLLLEVVGLEFEELLVGRLVGSEVSEGGSWGLDVSELEELSDVSSELSWVSSGLIGLLVSSELRVTSVLDVLDSTLDEKLDSSEYVLDSTELVPDSTELLLVSPTDCSPQPTSKTAASAAIPTIFIFFIEFPPCFFS